MIKFYDQVPQVYNNASRDFQYLSWLIDIVLNSVKHNIDDMYDLPNTKTDSRLTELLALTLGFKIRRNYNQQQLASLVSIIPSILRYKGTAKAISLAGNALIKASGAAGEFKCNLVDNCLEIQLPEDLVDVVLFTDLLPYIAPAGLTTRVITKTDLKTRRSTELKYHDVPKAVLKNVLDWDQTNQKITGLATLFEDSTLNSSNVPEFANFKQTESTEGALVLNTGLLSNSIIPAIDQKFTDKVVIPTEEETGEEA